MSFHRVCDVHDICYSTCGASRKECDDNLLAGLTAAFETLPPGEKLIFARFPVSAYNIVRKFGCSSFDTSMNETCGCVPDSSFRGGVQPFSSPEGKVIN